MGAERRLADRKTVDPVNVSDITSLSSYSVLANTGNIIDSSIRGFLLQVERKNLIPSELRQNLNLDHLVNQQVVMYLPQMNLDLDGVITRTNHKGGGIFETAIDFSTEVPEYWRECLIDLLPSPGELD